jgi:hypothetical protein
MKYILDSNCFITPHRGYCPIDVAVSLWNKIKDLAINNTIVSLDKVRDELYKNNDELKKWLLNNIPNSFFLKFEDNSVERLQKIIRKAASSTFYTESAKEKYLKMDKADIYLTAFASINPDEWTIVTFETSEPNKISEIKLPQACQAYGIHCIYLIDMFREIHETF